MTSLTHPKLMQALGNFFQSTGVFQQNAPSRDTDGAEVAAWATVAGLEAVPCAIAPITRMMQEQIRERLQVYDRPLYRVLLKGYYPAVVPGMRLLADGKTYEVLPPSHDSQHAATGLFVVELYQTG